MDRTTKQSEKLLVWTIMPSPHQTAFFAALRARGVNLRVHYFGAVPPERLALGWSQPTDLPEGEHQVAPHMSSLYACEDWRERVHIVPGYGWKFSLALALRLSESGVEWLHWSERSHGGWRWWLTYPVKAFYATLVNHFALGALAIGSPARRDFRRWGMRDGRIAFLPYAVEPPLMIDEVEYNRPLETSCRFLYLGRLEAAKGTDVLLHAFARTLRRFPQARLRLTGVDISCGAYREQTRELGVEEQVSFREPVPVNRVGYEIARCDVLVLPSLHDGWGVVLNEAAALGKALIATEAAGAAWHLIEHKRNGWRIPAADVDALAEAMSAYAAHPALAVEHGRRSQVLFQDFTPARNASRLVEAIAALRAGTALPVYQTASS